MTPPVVTRSAENMSLSEEGQEMVLQRAVQTHGPDVDGDDSATIERKQVQAFHDPDVVLVIASDGVVVSQVPFVNIMTFAPSVVKRVVFMVHNGIQYKVYRSPGTKQDVEAWAYWLVTQKTFFTEDSTHNLDSLGAPFLYAASINDTDYKDALLDTYVAWSKRNDHPEIHGHCGSWAHLSSLAYNLIPHRLEVALTLHHNARAAVTRQRYSEQTCQTVIGQLILNLNAPGKAAKDPYKTTPEEFCKAYHYHWANFAPCYRTRELPAVTSQVPYTQHTASCARHTTHHV